jgi:hypothetical protein
MTIKMPRWTIKTKATITIIQKQTVLFDLLMRYKQNWFYFDFFYEDCYEKINQFYKNWQYQYQYCDQTRQNISAL